MQKILAQHRIDLLPVKKGDHVVMFDQEAHIEVFVISDGQQLRVLDKQGFLHVAELEEIEGSFRLRSLVPGKSKSSAGYNPEIQEKLKWQHIIETVVGLASLEGFTGKMKMNYS